MATHAELALMQKTSYFDLRTMQLENEKRGIEVFGLDTLLTRTVAGMSKEDVAWVEQQVSKLK